ncbi:S-adenosyl-L-methionine-dependent methyltransferase [Pavlovales sp. CCMP2436]|nr:S-adenosyl-L-methionine-dependent methyltransferase [Pavlovales sp. CCMP2436]
MRTTRLLMLALAASLPSAVVCTAVAPARSANAVKARLVSALGGGVRDAVLASPLTAEPLMVERSVLGRSVQLRFRDASSGRVFRDNGVYVDLTPESARAPEEFPSLDVLAKSLWAAAQDLLDPAQFGTQLFRNPAISFVYERGWRQQFNMNGFPGIDTEFAEVRAFFEPVAQGGVVLDISCGSGLMTRRLVSTRQYRRVLGADYSEAMLAETAARFRAEGVRVPELVRCDVGALPFQSGSISAAHAGAALHCWPEAEKGLAEIRRCLRPGGRFFATTFLTSAMIGSQRVGGANGVGFRVFELDELRAMFAAAGFVDIEVRKEGRGCAICKATAPAAPATAATTAPAATAAVTAAPAAD